MASSTSDRIKLGLAVLPLAAAVWAFYQYEEQSLLLRVVGLLVAAGVSAAIAYQAEAGKAAVAFLRAAYIEARKVVWPSRKETAQTTLVVLLVVIIVALFLWLLDMLLGWAVRFLTG